MLVVMIGIRKLLDCIFTRRELKILDDIMPDFHKKAKDDELQHLEDGTEVGFYRKFVTCCIGEKSHKLKNNRNDSSVHR